VRERRLQKVLSGLEQRVFKRVAFSADRTTDDRPRAGVDADMDTNLAFAAQDFHIFGRHLTEPPLQ